VAHVIVQHGPSQARTLRIVDAHLIELAVPLARPFKTAAGTIEDRRVVLVGASDGELTGWGEAAPYPGMTPDTIEGVWNGLVGEIALTPTGEAALEEAAADLAARLGGRPLWSAIGGSWRPQPASLAIGLDDDPIERIEATAPAAVKLKIRPGEDLARVEAVRQRHLDLIIGVDANAGYTWDDHDPLLELDRLDVAYVEQPFHPGDLESHAALREELLADVVVDEPIDGIDAALRVIEAGAADVVAVTPGRIGLEACRIIHDLALVAGLRIKASGLLETAVGRAHTLAVSMLPGSVYSDLGDEGWFLVKPTVISPMTVSDGWISAAEGPGIGVEPDLDALARFVVRETTVTRPAGPGRG